PRRPRVSPARLLEGEEHRDLGSESRFARQADLSPVRLQDLPGNGEAQSPSGKTRGDRAGAAEGVIERPRALLRAHPHAGVLDNDVGVLPGGAGANLDLSPLGRV